MQQLLHLLIVDRGRGAALAARHGSRWLLPVISCGEMVRTAPLVARWCAERGVASDVAGQWLGRVGRNATDWLMAIPARNGCPAVDATLEWIPLAALSSSASVLDYQTWALATALARGALPSVAGPFGHLGWPEEVRTWIGESVGSAPSAWTPYRVGAHEVVLGAETACGRVYFKGLTAGCAVEARLTQVLAELAPDSFARTLALERRDDGSGWWLMAGCPGQSGKDLQLAAQALARIQQRVMAAHHGPLPLQAVDVEAAVEWAGELFGDSACGAVVRRQCAKAMRAEVHQTWIPMDLDPTNVLVDGDGAVRFIDVDDSFVGPAPLAMAILSQRCGGQALYHAYEQSWSPPLTRVDWPAFEVAAKVIESWLGWRRLERNIERGEVHAALDPLAARVRARLDRAIYRR
jgi:hypothetical protein